ncbi:MAG: hypothetical protein ABH852_01680 [Methanobacteriota archaeon]
MGKQILDTDVLPSTRYDFKLGEAKVMKSGSGVRARQWIDELIREARKVGQRAAYESAIVQHEGLKHTVRVLGSGGGEG